MKIGDRAKFLEVTFYRQRDVFNPARMEITKMVDENLVHSFWTRQLFLDSCKRWEKEQDTGILTACSHFALEIILEYPAPGKTSSG